jgi:hypothetical protein
MSNVVRKCHECGVGEIRPVARAGRRARYKTMELEIPSDVKILTCNNCGAEGTDLATAKAIDAAMEKVYREVLRKMLAESIKKIRAHVPMRRLEQLLGLSEGYLSKISGGRAEPSAELVAHLATLSTDVAGRTMELERLWQKASQPPTRRKAA